MKKAEKMETIGNGGGNTISPPPRLVPSKFWTFTYYYNELETLDQMEHILKKIEALYIFGKEICPTTGKKHIQGYIEFKTKIRPIETLKWCKTIHWEKRKGTRDQNLIYCSKENDYNTNFDMSNLPKPLKDPLEGLELYEYQKWILDLIKTPPDDRSIIWLYEENGKMGKTKLCKHMAIYHKAIVLNGKGGDIRCGVALHVLKEGGLNIAIFHFTRTTEGYVSYEALEQIKDGMFFSGKYESGQCIYNCPHVIIFANFRPNENDITKLSTDRWNIFKITSDGKLSPESLHQLDFKDENQELKNDEDMTEDEIDEWWENYYYGNKV